MVSLQLTGNGHTVPLGCGATLAAQEWIITAAHCMGVSVEDIVFVNKQTF